MSRFEFDPVPTVAPTGAPGNDYQSIPAATPEAFGGLKARAEQTLGQGVENASEAGLSVLTARQRLNNEITDNDTLTWFAQEGTARTEKFKQLEGRSAVDALSRELHFKSGKDWRAYNERYGVTNATATVVQALAIGARRTALMKEFGTKPAESFDRDMNFLKAQLQQESERLAVRLGKLTDAQAPKPTPEVATEIAALQKEIEDRKDAFNDFERWDQALRNRFAQIDGSSQRPVNRTLANLSANWMAIQRMAKLGRVALTHFASLPTKAMEARYWGIPFAERYASLFSGLTQGAEGSAKREALDATLVAFENRLGHMMAMYDVADAPAGMLAKWETTFFKLTGVSSVIDNQRGDAEAMFAAHIGGKRGQAWADIGPKEQRVLQGFGIGEAEWKALHQVEWSKFGERTYLTPSDALKLSDDQVRAYLKEAKAAELGRNEPTADDIAKGREDLATTLATTYSDRAGFAIPMPSARIRAMLFGKNFEPGTALNTALRLFYQFKIWPADMIVRAWGREMYGTIGDGRLDRVAGLTEAAVGAIIFGVAAEGVRALIQGRDPLKELQEHPLGQILKGGQRSGFGSLVGDFLLGQFDRHNFSAVASLAGPTFSQIDTLMDLLHAGGETGLMRQEIDRNKRYANPPKLRKGRVQNKLESGAQKDIERTTAKGTGAPSNAHPGPVAKIGADRGPKGVRSP